MNQETLRIGLTAIARDEIDETVDLSNAILVRAQAVRQTRSRRRRRLVTVAVATLAFAVLAGPSALAAAQQWIAHLGVTLVQPSDVGRPAQPAPGASAAGGPLALDLTLVQAQERVTFHIRALRDLPADVAFRGVSVAPDSSAVVLSYARVGGSSGNLWLQIEPNAGGSGYVLPASAAEETTVLGLPAVYIPGGWGTAGSWNTTIDAALLSWTDGDGLTYVLGCSGLGLSRDNLRDIAASMR